MPNDDEGKKEKRGKEKVSKDKKKDTPVNDNVNKDDVEKEMQRLLESGVWKAIKQEDTGKIYYYHTKTKKTCWDLRREILKEFQGAGGMCSANVSAKRKTVKRTEDLRSLEGVENEKDETRKKGKEEESGREKDAVSPVIAASSVPLYSLKNKDNDSDINDDNDYTSPVLFSEKENKPAHNETYKDPLERLIHETSSLEQIIGSSGNSKSMALEFQHSHEALVRTNKALTAQMVKMKREYDAMAMSLKDANIKVYEKDLALRELQCRACAVNKEDEAERTLVFLREQNQELVRQVGELTVVLSRGFNELAYQKALTLGIEPFTPELIADNFFQLNQKGSLGSKIDYILTNPITRKLLCCSCTGELERLRLSLLPEEERAVVSPETNYLRQPAATTTKTNSGDTHHAHYVPASSHGVTFNRLGHPVTSVEGEINDSVCGKNNYIPPPLPSPPSQEQRQGKYGINIAAGSWHSSLSPPISAAPKNPYTENVVVDSKQQQQPSSYGHVQERMSSKAKHVGGGNELYSDYFPSPLLNTRSTSRNFSVSGASVFGGFHIRPSY